MGDRKYTAVVGLVVGVAAVAGTIAGLAAVASNVIQEAKQKQTELKEKAKKIRKSSKSVGASTEDWKWQEICRKHLVLDHPLRTSDEVLAGFDKAWRQGSVVCGNWKKLNPATAWNCFQYLALEDVCVCMAVCKSWNKALFFLQSHISHIVDCSKQGFPPRLRGACWTYIRKVVADPSQEIPYQVLLKVPCFMMEEIKKDAHRTMIHYQKFSDRQQAIDALTNLLHAYVVADPEVGYCQGMNFVAASVLIAIPDQEQAFQCFFMLMTHPRYSFRELYLEDLSGLKLAKYQFDCLMQWYHPKLAKHLKSLDLWEGANYNTSWFMTLFSRGELPRATVDRIWDYIFGEGYRGMFQVGLAILDVIQDKVLAMDYEQTFNYLRTIPDQHLLNPDIIIKFASRYQIPYNLLIELRTHFLSKVKKSYMI
eukprot:gb/GEZN01006118.1/.p1 GENE.gb/GEZN01006118.1/~~gb/GEZN01006118.1/.p1  ORF type:complete len:423 (-),score=58.49 gb/GEZN01006118.1/:352-1620(-)